MPIEKTSKPLKAAQAFVLFFMAGSAAAGFYQGTQESITLGAYGVGAGVVAYLVVRLVGWWQYG